jgi:protein-L-isoaspartate(D-aspartate) O-methyltransferase
MKSQDRYLAMLKPLKLGKKTQAALGSIDRSLFFDRAFKKELYSEKTLPIGNGETSDDPRALAKMIDLLQIKKNCRVLEVGTGSGYSTAVLAKLAGLVVTVEFHEKLALEAKARLLGAGLGNVAYFAGDATEISHKNRFDAVIIFAACVLTPQLILDTLVPGGVAVFPMGPAHQQQIARYVRNDTAADPLKNFTFHDLCAFNSIRGPYGWRDQIEGYFIDDTGA